MITTPPRFSVIVATIGRDTLPRALRSLASQPLSHGDEVLVVGASDRVNRLATTFGYTYIHCKPGGDYGAAERTLGMEYARGTHLAFLDDDDVYLPGAFNAMRQVAVEHPASPIMFRMIDPNGALLWMDPEIRMGNHGTPQFVPPNYPTKLGKWTSRYEGDFDFCTSTLALYPPNSLIWSTAIIYACRPK
jgi:glycosyltransferase involved in cell wall biosynthesis